MAKVAIVTDSTSCLPPDLAKQYDIRVVPFHLVLDGRDYLDQIDITPNEFYELLPKLSKLPTTSTPSPGEFAGLFSELAKNTDSIVCVTVSSALTGAFQSAVQAKSLVEGNPNLKIEVIDSKSSVGALAFIVIEAARAASEGKNLLHVVNTAQQLVSRVKYTSAFDTLKYLIRSGRAPKTAYIGELLHVKPLIGLVDNTGLVVSLGKERGKRKALNKIVDLVKNYADTSRPLHFMAHYSSRIEDAQELTAMVSSKYDCAESYLTELTPVMTVHTGPMVGLSFYA